MQNKFVLFRLTIIFSVVTLCRPRTMKWPGKVALTEVKQKYIPLLIPKVERKIQLERQSHRYKLGKVCRAWHKYGACSVLFSIRFLFLLVWITLCFAVYCQSDLKSILLRCYVQKVNCFFSSISYLTENTLSILQTNDISMNRSSCKMPVSFVDFNEFEFWWQILIKNT
jgi:hypothetical protein